MAKKDETRYLIVYPQVNYQAPAVNGKYQPLDPLLTREQLEEKLPALLQNPGGTGAGIRIYEVSRYVPVKTRIELDGEEFKTPDKKPTANDIAKARQGIVTAANVVEAGLAVEPYYDDGDEYGDEEDY